MHDIMRNRIMRKLEVLPERQLYEVLDYIEFVESKYAAGRAPEPTGIQRFAERLEDRMRVRTVTPRFIGGAMTVLGAAGRVAEGLARAGREVAGQWSAVTASPGARREATERPSQEGADRRVIAVE